MLEYDEKQKYTNEITQEKVNEFEREIIGQEEIPNRIEESFNDETITRFTITDSSFIIPHNFFTNLLDLEELIVPSDFILFSNKLFYVNDHTLYSIDLPCSVDIINNKKREDEPMKSFTIPLDVTKLGNYCFANCFLLNEIIGIERIREFGKGCFLNCPKLKRSVYPQVEESVDNQLKELVSINNRKQLEEWTGMKCNDILFDSKVDNWNQHTSMFTRTILGIENIIILIEDEDNEIFGFFVDTKLCINFNSYGQGKIGRNSFEFNLQSNGRLTEPMKFDIKQNGGCCYTICKDYDEKLIEIGDIIIYKQEFKNESYCIQSDYYFDYKGIRKALCGKKYDNWKNKGKHFIPKRISVIEMK